MDVFITFYGTTDKNYVNIYNGYSFVHHLLKGYDLFFKDGISPEAIEQTLKDLPFNPDRIFCTISFYYQLKYIKSIVDERWVVGGPFMHYMANKVEWPCQLVSGPFEKYLGLDYLPDVFTPYFESKLPAIKEQENNPIFICYNCSINQGCYWGKCSFCDYKKYEDYKYSRPNISNIIKQLKTTIFDNTQINLCTSAILPDVLEQVLPVRPPEKTLISFFARADKSIVDIATECDCTGYVFNVGVESLSQTILDKLNKNVDVEDVIRLTQAVLNNGGMLQYSVMDHYIYANKQAVLEVKESLKKLKSIIQQKPKNIWFYNNGPTYWPDVQQIDGYESKKIDFEFFNLHMAILPENSEAYICNREISEEIASSKISVLGKPFESLKTSAVWRWQD